MDQDITLMLQFQAGDESCFEQLVDRHKQSMFNLAYRFLGNVQDAEDVTQELFISVYRSVERYEPKAKLTTWLYRICRNGCIKKLRDRKAKNVSLSMYDDHSTPAAGDGRPDQHLLAAEQAAVVKRAIDSLPERQRFAVVMFRYERCSYEQIATTLECSIDAVKVLLHRARRNLKEILKDYVKR
jgi:RNA polymerase sigma-70 factor (ECF subfamily)